MINMNNVKLINNNITGSSGLYLLHGAFSYSWKNLTSANPIEGGYGNTEALFNGWENPTMNLTFHLPIDTSYVTGSFLSWSAWNAISKNQYDGTNDTQTKIRILIGDSDTPFTDYSSSSSNLASSDIPIIINGYTLNFSPGDSYKSAFWTINAQVQVTK